MPESITPYIPSTITVHIGPANQWGENVTVSFLDYVKNVAASEIYPTWHEAALRANILAQISFALNRVYTEYYRSRGYDFDITSSTMNDQKFIKGRNTFETTDRLAEELFTTYVRRRGTTEPLSTRFCNGTTVTCEGLSQWGSESLAQQGYDYLSILRRYYGDDIELVVNAPVRDIFRSYPGSPLRRGDSGEDVTILQVMLNRIGQNYPAIPRIPLPATRGIFEGQTEAAVRKFQQIFNLTVDGVVGEGTWYELIMLYVGVTRLSELNSEGQSLYRTLPPISYDLQEGATGPVVSVLQFVLSVLGQVNESIPTPAIDGDFGPATRRAVLAAQALFGLPQTGVVSRETWVRLYDEYQSTARALRPDVALPTAPADISEELLSGQFPGYELRFGSSDGRSGA